MRGLLPFVLLAAASGIPPEYPADRPGAPHRPAPSRSVPTPKPVPSPEAPLANVPDATLRRRASVWPDGQPPDALDRVRRARALGGVNPETGAHRRGLSETLAALRANGWDVDAADRAMRGGQ